MTSFRWGERGKVPLSRGVDDAIARLAERLERPVEWVADEVSVAYHRGDRQPEPGHTRGDRFRQHSPNGTGVYAVVRYDSSSYGVVVYVDRNPGVTT